MVETRERWWKSSGTYGENLVKNMEKKLSETCCGKSWETNAWLSMAKLLL
jgi:hypothetical protein